jgi:hypothetical protein
MIFLYLNNATGIVECSPEAMTRPEVQKVYKAGKEHFKAVCCGIYWIFRPRNLYSNKPLTERIKIVNEDYLKNFDTTWEVLAKAAGTKAMLDCYIDLSTTLNDRAVDNLMSDFDALIEALNEVPTKTDIDVSSGIEVMCDDKVARRVTRSAKVSVPNFEMKEKFWNSFAKFSKTLKEIQEVLKIEEEERAKAGSDVYLYDNPQANSTMKIVNG